MKCCPWFPKVRLEFLLKMVQEWRMRSRLGQKDWIRASRGFVSWTLSYPDGILTPMDMYPMTNSVGQAVNPITGKTIGRSDPIRIGIYL